MWTLALASSSNRPLIDLVLEVSGLAQRFSATVSSEEVPRGKPAPDALALADDVVQQLVELTPERVLRAARASRAEEVGAHLTDNERMS